MKRRNAIGLDSITIKTSFVCLIVSLSFTITSCTMMGIRKKDAAIFNPGGQLLINIYDWDYRIAEFSFSTADQGVRKIYESAPTLVKNAEGVEQHVIYSENFERTFKAERLYRDQMENELRELLSAYDYDKFKKKDWRIEKPENKVKRYFLKTGRNTYEGKYSWSWFPNLQFSFAVYNPCPMCNALLIDLTTKEVFPVFGDDTVQTSVWNKGGTLVAYIATKSVPSDKRALVVFGISDRRVILRKTIDDAVADGIGDLVFSPDSKYIAIVTYTMFPGLWPHHILMHHFGHGIFYKTYTLEIYDISGQLVFKKRIDGSYKNSVASIVWVN